MTTDKPVICSWISSKNLFARLHTVQGLRELADFLEANPAVPSMPSARTSMSSPV